MREIWFSSFSEEKEAKRLLAALRGGCTYRHSERTNILRLFSAKKNESLYSQETQEILP
jgi:hypothetical protein